MANSSQDMDDFEKKVLKFTTGNPEVCVCNQLTITNYLRPRDV